VIQARQKQVSERTSQREVLQNIWQRQDADRQTKSNSEQAARRLKSQSSLAVRGQWFGVVRLNEGQQNIGKDRTARKKKSRGSKGDCFEQIYSFPATANKKNFAFQSQSHCKNHDPIPQSTGKKQPSNASIPVIPTT
jgi:hypothetical protein